jgi:hypothetical protein
MNYFKINLLKKKLIFILKFVFSKKNKKEGEIAELYFYLEKLKEIDN